MTAAGTPLIGTTDWGEDEALPAIPHIIGFQLPVIGNSGLNGGYVTPATAGQGASYCANCLPYGARLRLHASFTCPPASSYPQANKICNQLKTYGMIFDDTESTTCTPNATGAGACVYGLRFGKSSNGSNPWNGDGCCGNYSGGDLDSLLLVGAPYYLHITDFDIMTLGTIR